MKRIAFFISFLVFSMCSSGYAQKRIVGYVMGSNIEVGKTKIDVAKLTHLNYAFASIEEGKVVIGAKDGPKMAYLNKLKADNPDLKILISIGGWTRSGGFSDAVLTAESRAVFAKSAIEFMELHSLDGIDLDWEYPGLKGIGNTFRVEDKVNFTSALRLLRKLLDEKEKQDGQHYLLTIASAASQSYMDNVEMEKISEVLDFMNIMTYDYFGAWSTTTGNHARLYPNGDEAVRRHLEAGAPKEKLTMGVAFYGRGWWGVKGINQPASKNALMMDYNEIKEGLNNGYVEKWDSMSMSPHAWNENSETLIGYDNPRSLRLKSDYVRDSGLGGIMFWEYSGDADGELLGTVHQEFNTIPGHSHNDYEQEEPLTKALSLGFKSIEVDVHLIDDELYVSHNRPYNTSNVKTLEEMYLKPLAASNFIQDPLYLLIDVKTDAEASFHKLHEVLKKYQSEQVVYIISGNRAIDLIANDLLGLMGIDGRPNDLEKPFSSKEMPLISQNYKYFFSSRDPTKIDLKEKERFTTFVKSAHRRNILVRLWATPDNQEMWRFLQDQGVDLINTDDPEALQKYYLEGPK